MRRARQTRVAIPPATWHESIAALKRELIEQALRRSGGNRTRAAEALGLERTYLLRLMRRMGLSAPRQSHRAAHRHAPVSAAAIRPAMTAR
jgi:DNA-binding NtrC family response regulator